MINPTTRNFRYVNLARSTVAVAPTLTILSSVLHIDNVSALRIEIINDDGVQTLSVRFDKSDEPSGPWATSDYTGFVGILPGETRNIVVDVRWLKYIRLTGTSSGAGLNARVSVTSFVGDLSW